MPNLKRKIAVVTGASRGAGRGIARQLGEAGATVYVTGRTVKGGPATDSLPGTIDDTAEEVTQRGGKGIAVQCDHTDAAQVEALFARVKKESGRLDLLVNNAWGGYEQYDGSTFDNKFWDIPLDYWERMINRGVRLGWLSSRFATPLMIKQKSGLIVFTTSWYGKNYVQGLVYDLARHSVHRLTYTMALELKQHGIATACVAPGFMRTERVLAAFKADESNWQDYPGLKDTESPEYVGRAIAHLAADPNVMDKSGKAFGAGHLAEEYGFTDIDGRRIPPFTIPKSMLMD